MMLSKNELNGFHRMFCDAHELTDGTDDALYWLTLRDALCREAALEYLRHCDVECIFVAVQLRCLACNNEEWESVSKRLDLLREGHKIKRLSHDWEGAWAVVLQTIFRADWAAQDEIRAHFFRGDKVT